MYEMCNKQEELEIYTISKGYNLLSQICGGVVPMTRESAMQ